MIKQIILQKNVHVVAQITSRPEYHSQIMQVKKATCFLFIPIREHDSALHVYTAIDGMAPLYH